jgi:hypothetical protein
MSLIACIQSDKQSILSDEDFLMKKVISENLDEALTLPEFFSLPFDKICSIIQISPNKNSDICCKMIDKLCETHPEKAPLVLNSIDLPNTNLEECIKIISSLKTSPICIYLGHLYQEELKKVEVDYEYEIGTREKEIHKYKEPFQNLKAIFENP